MSKKVFILTDSSQRYFDPDDENSVEVVQTTNVPADELREYSPLALFYDEDIKCERTGLAVKTISGDDKKVTIEGFIKRGILPIPVTETFQIGDTYSADGMFSVSSDGSSRSQGSVIITQIVLAKDEDDVAGVLNAIQKLNTVYGRKISSAEESVMDNDGILRKAESENFDVEDYNSFMAEIGMSSYPQERYYQSNV